MKKMLSMLLALAMCLCALPSLAEESADNADFLASIGGEGGTTYANLFDVILADEYDYIWQDYCAAVMGKSAAADTVTMLKDMISADEYGPAVAQKYGNGENGFSFDCWYINGAQSFTIDGNTITTTLTDGTSETHTYEYQGVYQIGADETMVYGGMEFCPAFDCTVYKSTDDAGEFTYFFFRDDTMETTYHLEFRYGSDIEALQQYMKGTYAYWLAAGFDASADINTVNDVIALFCLENMDYSTRTDEATAQIAELVGTWNADLSGFGDEYADVELSTTIDETGHGITVMNGEQTVDYYAYAFDNGDEGDGQGVYVAYNTAEGEAEAAEYTIAQNENGETTLTFTNDEGSITYVKAE